MLVVETDGEIEVVTLNNPTKYNAFNAAALAEFNAYFAGLRKRYAIMFFLSHLLPSFVMFRRMGSVPLFRDDSMKG